MTQHTELIERLRDPLKNAFMPTRREAAAALEAQAREIAGLQAARMAYASEFPPDGEGEPDVGSIHQNIRAMKAEIAELKAQESELCTLYGLAEAECKRLRADAERFLALERIVHWEQERDMGPGGRYWMAVHVSSGNPTLREAIDAMKGQP